MRAIGIQQFQDVHIHPPGWLVRLRPICGSFWYPVRVVATIVFRKTDGNATFALSDFGLLQLPIDHTAFCFSRSVRHVLTREILSTSSIIKPTHKSCSTKCQWTVNAYDLLLRSD